MISQVIVNVDSQLKKQAMKKAQGQGIPFSAVLKLAIKAFVEGHLNVGLVGDMDAKLHAKFLKAENDFTAGKNISPKFSTVAQGRAYLDN
ncbi:MAG: hypothetical protein WCT02_01505 [Candidatus Paceibacterota bacterium]